MSSTTAPTSSPYMTGGDLQGTGEDATRRFQGGIERKASLHVDALGTEFWF
jgi:hypothetical protein